ncbi:hypothetical protein YQE_11041, partial [Dendroctonus ponderosae]
MQRPKYTKLKNHAFIKRYQLAEVNVGDWYVRALQRVGDRATSRHPVRQFFSMQQKLSSTQPSRSAVNGGRSPKPDKFLNPPDVRTGSVSSQQSACLSSAEESQSVRHSRLDAFQSVVQARPGHANRTFSSLQAYQNHVASLQQRDEHSGGRGYQIGLCSPMPQRKFGDGSSAALGPSSLPETRSLSETRWRSPLGSPLPLRTNLPIEEPQYISGNTSPIILQRFYHQQKQQQLVKEAEESAKSDPLPSSPMKNGERNRISSVYQSRSDSVQVETGVRLQTDPKQNCKMRLHCVILSISELNQQYKADFLLKLHLSKIADL